MVHELRPYVARVEARQAKNKDSDAWTLLAARWEAVTGRSLSARKFAPALANTEEEKLTSLTPGTGSTVRAAWFPT